MTISIGLPGNLDHSMIRALAPRIEALGFRGLWLNDTPDGDSLAGLAVAASVTSTLQLGSGVIPLDRRPAAEIGRALAQLDLPRFTLGVGAGSPNGGLQRVADAIETLRPMTTAPIVVGGLGPKMRALGAKKADGVLLNWLTPDAARDAAADLRRDAGTRSASDRAAASGPARAALYARTITDEAARPALTVEAARYGRIPAYAANFARIGATAFETTIDGTGPDALASRAAEYTSVLDELVLRAITVDKSLESFERFVEAAAPE
jgi:alkanesulfonate monooxygenase SsuD/methylene tetrahydromethanopterin reductase-like flavin-dependent oxidoreductase (luciferase family)